MKESSFLNVMNPVKDKIYRMALRLLISREAAEDATQEVLLKLWNQKSRIKHYANVEAYTMTVTKNYCLDQLKLSQNNNLRLVHKEYENKTIALQTEIELNDEMLLLGKIVDSLPEQQKIIFQLRDIEHYDFIEISKVMKMKENAVRVALSRARKTIREKLIQKHEYGIK